jgi:hypothetical protein
MNVIFLRLLLKKIKNHEFNIWKQIYLAVETFNKIWKNFKLKTYDIRDTKRYWISTSSSYDDDYVFLIEEEEEPHPEIYIVRKSNKTWHLVDYWFVDFSAISNVKSEFPPSQGWENPDWRAVKFLQIILKEIDAKLKFF